MPPFTGEGRVTTLLLFIYCLTGPVPLCTPIMGPHPEHVASGWVGDAGGGTWLIRNYDGSLCRAGTPAGEYRIWQQACQVFDVDGDGDVDLMDFGAPQRSR